MLFINHEKIQFKMGVVFNVTIPPNKCLINQQKLSFKIILVSR